MPSYLDLPNNIAEPPYKLEERGKVIVPATDVRVVSPKDLDAAIQDALRENGKRYDSNFGKPNYKLDKYLSERLDQLVRGNHPPLFGNVGSVALSTDSELAIDVEREKIPEVINGLKEYFAKVGYKHARDLTGNLGFAVKNQNSNEEVYVYLGTKNTQGSSKIHLEVRLSGNLNL